MTNPTLKSLYEHTGLWWRQNSSIGNWSASVEDANFILFQTGDYYVIRVFFGEDGHMSPLSYVEGTKPSSELWQQLLALQFRTP